MSPKQLPAYFDRIAEAPGAVPRLRRFILDLAVRGKLVEQDPGDEPADRLFPPSQNRGTKAAARRSVDLAEEIAEAVQPFLLPLNWVWASLDSLCLSVTDGDHLPPPKTESGIPFLVIGNIRGRRLDFSGCRHVSEDYYQSLHQSRQPRRGDVLYTLVGSFGIPVVVSDDRPFCVQRHIGILRASPSVTPLYLARAMESELVFMQSSRCATGIAQKTVPFSGLRRLLIPLPPLAEQHRIVAKVDELMALCDRLEAAQAERERWRQRVTTVYLERLDSPRSVQDDRKVGVIEHFHRLVKQRQTVEQLRETVVDLGVTGASH